MKFPISSILPNNHIGRVQSGVARLGSAGLHSPHYVIRGESTNNYSNIDHESQLTFIDYIAFTVRHVERSETAFPLQDVILNLFCIPIESLTPIGKGRYGYTNSIGFGSYGNMLFGGASQRNTIHVQISGTGCKLVRDWLAVYTWGESNNVKLRRLDIAHDDHDGIEIDIARAINWYDKGLFGDRGRPPKRQLFDDFNDGSGKTFYVGARGNSRFVRIYEKGKQLGDPESKWCRAEIEFKAVDQIIPWSAVVDSDPFFAGAYKALSFLTTRQDKFERIRREEAIAFEQALHWARQHVGQFINLLCLKHDNDSEKVVADLRRDGIPKKLEQYFALYINKPRTE